jgi:hypothetical protein
VAAVAVVVVVVVVDDFGYETRGTMFRTDTTSSLYQGCSERYQPYKDKEEVNG